jgi:predicted acyl esterase
MKIFFGHIFLVLTLSVAGQGNDDAAYIRNNYSKKEVTIAVRDGAKLFTAIYRP